mmetsp:Transcript_16474/g.24666  ORF Transcript_16474/g.24666 Transcript_16474/m.24666 type:complete len:159 (+) Transcript_16474:32-508(+)
MAGGSKCNASLGMNGELGHSDRVSIARKHFVRKGYRVHSGLQFGCELVLYADLPSRVHSDFCVHIPAADTRLNWMTIQTLVRSMPELHKTLIIATIRKSSAENDDAIAFEKDVGNDQSKETKDYYIVDELAVATEHAPFRHKNITKEVGFQLKKQKIK